MSLVVARIAGNHACIVSETKLSPAGFEAAGLKEHPRAGVVKSTIVNARQCISFAGNEEFAIDAMKEIEDGGPEEDVEEILFRYHVHSDFQTEFIFCFVRETPHLISFRNGQVTREPFAWIGDHKAFEYYQRFYHGDFSHLSEPKHPPVTGEKLPTLKNLRVTVDSKVPENDFSKMSTAMDNLLYHHGVQSVGGFRIQVVYDENKFSYHRYQAISNEVIDLTPNETGRFGFINPSKGSYNITCAQGGNDYRYAAIHIAEANLGVLYIRKNKGLLKPKLCPSLDLIDFSDLVVCYDLHLLVVDEQRVPKYYQRAKELFAKEAYHEAIHWLCLAITYSHTINQKAHLYYVLGLNFHNYGRLLTARLCFEHAAALDPVYQSKLEEHDTILARFTKEGRKNGQPNETA